VLIKCAFSIIYRMFFLLFSATINGKLARLGLSSYLLLHWESFLVADLSKILIISERWTLASTTGVLIGCQPNGKYFWGLSFFLFVLIRCLFFACLQLFSAIITGMIIRRTLLTFLLNPSYMSTIRYIVVYLFTFFSFLFF